MERKLIDMHIHTTYYDGEKDPEIALSVDPGRLQQGDGEIPGILPEHHDHEWR